MRKRYFLYYLVFTIRCSLLIGLCSLFAATIASAQVECRWAQNITPTNADTYTIIAVAASADGFVYVAGKDVGGATVHFISKYDTAGTFIWKKPVDDSMLNVVNMTVDHNNQVVLVGWEYYKGIRLSKLDSAGNQLWLSGLRGYYNDGNTIAVDNANNIYVPARKNAGGQADTVFVKKVSAAGSFMQDSPPMFYVHELNVKVNNAGEIFVTGQVDASIGSSVFGKIGNTVIYASEPNWFYNNFLAKFSTAFTTDWIYTTTSSSTSHTNGICFGSNGDIYTFWNQKQRGVFAFNPIVKHFNTASVMLDSAVFTYEPGNIPFLSVASVQNQILAIEKPYHLSSLKDTVVVTAFNQLLQTLNHVDLIADYISFDGVADGAAMYMGGRFNDAGGVANVGSINIATHDPGDAAHYDLYLAKFGISQSTLGTGLLDFNAVRKASNIDLLWKAVAIEEVKQYNIERSTDGLKYSIIGSVAPRTSNALQLSTYNFTDLNCTPQQTYHYRLEQEFKNGRKEYSKVLAVHALKQNALFTFSPNPARNVVHVTISNVTSATTILIVDATGKKVLEQKVNTANTTVDVSNLPKGVFAIVVENGSGRQVQKLVRGK